MKTTFFLSACALMLVFTACGPAFTFQEPQPTDAKNLDEIPRRLQGVYLNQSDSSLLFVSDRLIFQRFEGAEWGHLSDLDMNHRLSGDSVTLLPTGRTIFAERKGDSLYRPVQYNDTLFSLSFDNVLRKYQGRFFMNTRLGPESWEVRMMELSRGTLSIHSVDAEEDWKSLRKITESSEDTLPVAVPANARQFKEFVRSNGFRDIEKYNRISR